MGQTPSAQAGRVTRPVSASGSHRADVNCAQDTAVTFELLSEPLLGLPVTLRVRREGGSTRNDYFRYTSSRWTWMSHGEEDGIFHLPPVEPQRAGVDGELVIVYYKDGGYFTKGTPIRSGKFILRNSVTEFDVSFSESTMEVVASAKVLNVAPITALAITQDGVHLSHEVLDDQTLRSQDLSVYTHRRALPAPRVHGRYDVVLLGGPDSSSTLAREALTIPASAVREVYDVAILTSSPLHPGTATATTAHDVATRTCAVPPQTTLRVRCTGRLQRGDALLLVRPNLSVEELQACARVSLNPSTGEATITIRESHAPPMNDTSDVHAWHVVLGLVHPTGALLPAAHAVVVVSRGATALPAPHPAPFPTASQPAPAAPESTSARSGFLCIICLDAVAVIKLEPCRHVCLCEACLATCRTQRASASEGDRLSCPVCRGRVTGHERVFLM